MPSPDKTEQEVAKEIQIGNLEVSEDREKQDLNPERKEHRDDLTATGTIMGSRDNRTTEIASTTTIDSEEIPIQTTEMEATITLTGESSEEEQAI